MRRERGGGLWLDRHGVRRIRPRMYGCRGGDRGSVEGSRWVAGGVWRVVDVFCVIVRYSGGIPTAEAREEKLTGLEYMHDA